MKPTLALILILSTFIPIYNAYKIDVKVFYESKCPDSRAFILQQLDPTWKSLSEIMNLTLVAYGKAKWDEFSSTFHCQHGPKECDGNKMLNCVTYLADQCQAVNFSTCIMNHFQGAVAAEQCAQDTGVNFDELIKCYDSDEGTTLMKKAADIQNKYFDRISYVPWIIINNINSREVPENAEYGLKDAICEAYKGTKPKACEK